MNVELAYAPELARYRLGPAHPMRPERFSLAVDLARAWGLVGGNGAELVAPQASSDDLLRLAHADAFIAAVREASADPDGWRGGFGINTGDTPAFPAMHEAAALAAGATTRALSDVVSGACVRAFSPAGGLHHAHRDRAAGFCVYNDLVVATEVATRAHQGLRVAYVDLDAHHGDGVQEAFDERDDVLTLSVHESGQYLYPGTGSVLDKGHGRGVGFTLNVPLPPDAGDECYQQVLERVIAPTVRAFGPDVIVAQLGADTHRNDPLTHLDTTVRGQYNNAVALVALADELCGGRIVATGGGGYDAFSATPRAWACVLAALLGDEPPADLPEHWRRDAADASGGAAAPPVATFDESSPPPPEDAKQRALAETQRVIDGLLLTAPLLRSHR